MEKRAVNSLERSTKKGTREMTAFKEFPVGTFVMLFYKTDHVWTCTVTEDMLDEVIRIAKPLSEEYIESEWARLGKAQEK